MKTVFVFRWVVAGLFMAGCSHLHTADSHRHTESEEEEHASEPAAHLHPGEVGFTRAQVEAVGLETETVAPAPFCAVIPVGGEILSPPGDEQTVVAPSSGVLLFQTAATTEGASVHSGQVLASISGENLQDGDPVRLAALAFESAEREYRRAERLAADTLLSLKEFESVRARYEAARAAYRGQADRLTSRGLTVVSPMTGYLKTRLVGQGEYVTAGQPIAVVVRNRRLQLRVEVPLQTCGELRRIRSAHFRTAGDDTVRRLADLDGRLLSVGQAVEGGYVPVTFEFDNRGDLLPGSFAEVYLLAGPREGTISVPRSALVEEQGLKFVYLRLDEELFKKQEVTLGADDGIRVEVLGGLRPGDRVVTRGAYSIRLASASTAIPAHNHNH